MQRSPRCHEQLSAAAAGLLDDLEDRDGLVGVHRRRGARRAGRGPCRRRRPGSRPARSGRRARPTRRAGGPTPPPARPPSPARPGGRRRAAPPPARRGRASRRRPPGPRRACAGGSSAASMLADRWLRTPFAWVRATKQSSSTRAPGRRRSSSACTATGRPNRTIAWSMRWLPRSASSPPASAGSGSSRQRPALTSGRQRSKRDSRRAGAPERALVQQPAQGQEVAVPAPVVEHRQHHPGRPRLVGQGAALGRARRQRLVDHHRQPRADRRPGEGRRGRGWAPRRRPGRARPGRPRARRPTRPPGRRGAPRAPPRRARDRR